MFLWWCFCVCIVFDLVREAGDAHIKFNLELLWWRSLGGGFVWLSVFLFAPFRRFLATNVWIEGHSLVLGAYCQVAASILGVQYGLSQLLSIMWLGPCGMRWDQLVLWLTKVVRFGRQPQLLLLHLGDNDFPHVSGMELVTKIIQDLHSVHQIFSFSRVTWVDLLHRRVWCEAHNPKIVAGNRWMCRIMQWHGTCNCTVRHLFVLPQLFLRNGVHFSSDGWELYLSNLSARTKAVLLADLGDERVKLA